MAASSSNRVTVRDPQLPPSIADWPPNSRHLDQRLPAAHRLLASVHRAVRGVPVVGLSGKRNIVYAMHDVATGNAAWYG